MAGCFRQSPELINMDLEYFRMFRIFQKLANFRPRVDPARGCSPFQCESLDYPYVCQIGQNPSWEKLECVEP